MGRLTTCVLLLLLAFSAEAGTTLAEQAGVTPADVAATRTYLVAGHEFQQAVKGDEPADEAAVHAVLEHVSSQCPNVLAGAPASKANFEIDQEILLEVTHAWVQPQRNATLAYAKKVQRLRWSNGKLTYFIRGQAAEARANAELVAPDICADARAFAASGFQTVPASTTRFLRQVNAANGKVSLVAAEYPPGELNEKILVLLKPYERPDEKALIPRLPSRHERERAEGVEVKVIFTPASEIKRVLGVPEAARGLKPAS